MKIKIFLTFFIIFVYFSYWGGWREDSIFALVRAVVNEGRFEIDSYANQTSDRAFYKDHYYTDKEPGLSFLSVPTYSIWRFIYNLFSEEFRQRHASSEAYITTIVRNNIPIIEYVNPGLLILISMLLVTIFTSSLLSALTLLLIYKISGRFSKKEAYRFAVTIIAGFGTLIFPNALILSGYGAAMFFSFLALYILFNIKHEKIKNYRYFVLAGLFCGFAVTISVMASIIAFIGLIYILFLDKKKAPYFILGGLIGILPFLVYNHVVFETPFTLPRYHLDPKIWYLDPKMLHKPGSKYSFQVPALFDSLRLLFYPHKGLFFYYPILLLSLVGLYYMYKKFKIESILFLLIFLAVLIMNSFFLSSWGGASFGARHLTLATPFLVLPLIFTFKKAEQKRMIKFFLLLLAILSIFINFTGLQIVRDEVIGEDKIIMAREHQKKINTF